MMLKFNHGRRAVSYSIGPDHDSDTYGNMVGDQGWWKGRDRAMIRVIGRVRVKVRVKIKVKVWG